MVASEFVKTEVLKAQRSYSEEFNHLGKILIILQLGFVIDLVFSYVVLPRTGVKLKGLANAAENYHSVLAENRRLYNEVQDLKGTLLCEAD